MGYAAEIIAFDNVRANRQRQALREQLHERFEEWLDEVEAQLPEAQATLAQVSETIGSLRQRLTASVAQTMLEQSHQEERGRQSLRCATCDRRLRARPPLYRTVRTLVGDLEIERPYFYCRHCRVGTYPLDAVLGLSSGHIQLDVQQAAAALATELPYETASALLGRLSGISVSSERLHTLTNQVAEGLSVLDVAPSRDAIDQRVAQVAAGRFRPPVLVLGIDGA
jgi:exonuclease VII large subunit